MERCPWARGDPAMARYHDEEWGVPVYDDRTLFEHLVLETFQAGLSWRLILHRREAFRRAFAGFDPAAVAAFGSEEIGRLAQDPRIVRNRAKIRAAIGNAAAFLRVAAEHGSFAAYSWAFVGGAPQQPRRGSADEIPTTSDEARAMAGDLKRRGFAFVGPTVVYAHMQATGMINDHLLACPRHSEVAALG